MSTASAGSPLSRWRQRLWRLEAGDLGPVVLRHQRIYILPTRRGLAMIATLTTMLLTSMNYSLSLGFALTFMVAGVVASALLQTYRNLAGIVATPLAAGEAFAGGKLEFTLSFASVGSERRGIVVRARSGPPVAVGLPRGATRPVQLAVATRRRGQLALGRVTVSTDFPLALWRGWAYLHFPLSGLVYPAPEVPPAALPPGPDGFDAYRSARAVDAELAGLRDYQSGDPLNRIAWKAVARGSGWHTKQFEGSGGSGPLELAWTDLPPGLGVEARLARLCAWILAAEREARAFSLAIPGTALASGSGPAHCRRALTALALYRDADTA
ncbi:MAG TPA: DUF58 domain-containing protein [Casimicrobiaceae bacterium]|nr:DUF58 domain-containing protein [Casimicrobiaceae bacterium]